VAFCQQQHISRKKIQYAISQTHGNYVLVIGRFSIWVAFAIPHCDDMSKLHQGIFFRSLARRVPPTPLSHPSLTSPWQLALGKMLSSTHPMASQYCPLYHPVEMIDFLRAGHEEGPSSSWVKGPCSWVMPVPSSLCYFRHHWYILTTRLYYQGYLSHHAYVRVREEQRDSCDLTSDTS
jgi:hypothetical protein